MSDIENNNQPQTIDPWPIASLQPGKHFYLEEGLMVLTERYHLSRGTCCGNGCRHCPFDYENVPG